MLIHLNFVQLRIARPTDQLDKVVSFYRDGLGLKELGGFKQHSGYDGVFLGLPSFPYHLEFTQYESGSPCLAPTKDNLLVFYMEDKGEIKEVIARLMKLGYPVVEPENPYWLENGHTFEDPDGWRVVLMNSPGISAN